MVLDFEMLDLAASHRKRLLIDDPESWSGMTVKVDGRLAILINPAHAQTRQCSTLMHELAHIILKHVPARVEVSATGMLLLSDYSEEQEGEADWLAGALLVPRDALIMMRRRAMSAGHIATAFCISEQMTEWRLRMTGVETQLKRSRR